MIKNMSIDFSKPYIVGVGGANLDVHAKIVSDAVMHDSNPSVVHSSVGGVTRNILDNLSRMGMQTTLLSSIGDDLPGKTLVSSCEHVGIDTSHILVSNEFSTGSYVAIIDDAGGLLVSSCDARAVENIPLDYLEDKQQIISNAAAIVCDTNLDARQLVKVKELSKNSKLFLDPVSGPKAEKIKDIIDVFYFIKPNRFELSVLSGMPCDTDSEIQAAAKALIDKGVHSVAVSLTERGCFYIDADGNEFFRSLGHTFVPVDTTGAGDAFMAGMVYAFANKFEIKKCLDFALAAGVVAILSDDTINPQMSCEYITEIMKKYSKEN